MTSVARSEPEEILRKGEIFADRYEVEDLLGRGGMGAVYRVRDFALGEVIALKVLAFGPDPSPTAVLRFRQEVRLARRVTHPNVARVYDIGEHQGTIYLTMELIDGGSLRDVLRAERRLTPARTARVARALCAGLQAIHAGGVIHRDLKPANVLLDRAGRVVIVDFGIARGLVDSPSLTIGALGTPTYMAPEQACGGAIDARTDLYALGLVLYEMLSGERPQAGPDRIAAELQGHGAPPAVAVLIARCLSPQPEGRPGSAEEVSRALAHSIPSAGDQGESGERTLTDRGAPAPGTVAEPASGPPPAESRAGAGLTGPLSFVMDPLGDQVLAVLPFRYRGAAEHDYLGDAITDEIVDALSRTRSLRVLGSGATARYRDARDAQRAGRDLGAFAIIDGAVQVTGDRVRITTRLIDVASGVQLWSDRHEGSYADLLVLQESIARRIAEELRFEITTHTHRGDAPSAAIEHYLTARGRLRALDYRAVSGAAATLESCLGLAPDFAPALAAHAIASLRCWFFEFGEDPRPDWEKVATASVARALAKAPDLAETHLAAGMLATQRGDYPAAARSLARALAIAPTCADAHEYLGVLQCEAGQAEAGVKRLRLADELEPTLTYSLLVIARDHALHGRFDDYETTMETVERRRGPYLGTTAFRIRIAAWRGDLETIARWCTADRHGSANWQLVRHYGRSFLGEIEDKEVDRGFAQAFASIQNPRRISLATQLAVEVYAGLGRLEEARVHLLRAATSVLVDLEWLDRCPLLVGLRELPDFKEARRRVHARAETIWCP